MFLTKTGKAAYRFRKLVLMPFGFTAKAFSSMLPFIGFGAALALAPWLAVKLLAQSGLHNISGLLAMFAIAGFLACQCAVFCLTLLVAIEEILPQSPGHAVSRYRNTRVLVEKMFPAFMSNC